MIEVRRIYFLDWLRIIAFLSVFIGHKFYEYLVLIPTDPTVHASLRDLTNFILPLFAGGGAGVVIFFLVSGFIIANVLFKEDSTGFLIKRIFRIYPLYIVAVTIQAFMNGLEGKHIVTKDLLVQMTLLGDFFHIPCALGGVAWTLRIEILFYLFMALLKHFGLIKLEKKKALLAIILIPLVILQVMPPFPSMWDISGIGNLNLYAPFLLLGVAYCLHERRIISQSCLILITVMTLYCYWLKLPTLQPHRTNQTFTLFGFAVFLIFYISRNAIRLPKWALITSEVTYSVYLFHNWLFDKFQLYLAKLNSHLEFQLIGATIFLFLFCISVTYLIEKPSVKMGAMVSKKLQRYAWKDF